MTFRGVIRSPSFVPSREVGYTPTLGAGGGPSVNDARYADFVAFADPRAGLYAVPDGLGGKRKATAAEFWATPANVTIDSATNGVPDFVLSAETQFSAAVAALFQGTEWTAVLESYGRASTGWIGRVNGAHSFAEPTSTGDNAQMFNGTTSLIASRRRGAWQNRSRYVSAKHASGRRISFNGGAAAADANIVGSNYLTPRLVSGFRGSFFGIASTAWSAQKMKDNSFPESSAVINGDSFAQATGVPWHTFLSASLPGSPPMENMGLGGTDGATIEAAFLSESSTLAAKRIVWGGHNAFDAADWQTRIANMVANTFGGLSNFLLLPTFIGTEDSLSIRNAKSAMHAYFKVTYGIHYLGSLMDSIVALGGPGQVYEDLASYALGATPAGLRITGDALHLNALCNETITAPAIRAHYPQLGWRV